MMRVYSSALSVALRNLPVGFKLVPWLANKSSSWVGRSCHEDPCNGDACCCQKVDNHPAGRCDSPCECYPVPVSQKCSGLFLGANTQSVCANLMWLIWLKCSWVCAEKAEKYLELSKWFGVIPLNITRSNDSRSACRWSLFPKGNHMSCSQIPGHGKWNNFCMGAANLVLGSPDLWGWLGGEDLGHGWESEYWISSEVTVSSNHPISH